MKAIDISNMTSGSKISENVKDKEDEAHRHTKKEKKTIPPMTQKERIERIERYIKLAPPSEDEER